MKGRGGTSGPRELLRITQGGWLKTGSIPGAETGPQQGKQAGEPSGSRKRVARSGRWGAERRAQNTEKDIRGRGCRPVCAYRAAVRLRPSGRPQRCPPAPAPQPCGVIGEERLSGRIPSRGGARLRSGSPLGRTALCRLWTAVQAPRSRWAREILEVSGGALRRYREEMAKSLLASSLSVRTKILQTGVSLYNTTHGFHEEEVKKILEQFPGGSIDLQKKQNGIGILTLNNSNKMNAFSGAMMLQLLERVIELENWTEGKGLIVHGAKNTFCSGSDLNAVKALSTPENGVALSMFMQNTLTRFMRLPLISVALVQGWAMGGGAELTTACDFRLMTEESVIRFVHKEMGIVPSWGGASRLVEIIGSRQALKVLSGTFKLDSKEALRIGLADEVLQPSDEATALEQAQEWLEQFVSGPAQVIRGLKKSVCSGRELYLEEALQNERDVLETLWGGPANLEAIAKKGKHTK